MDRARASADRWVAGRYRRLQVIHQEDNLVSWSGEDAETDRPCLVQRIELAEHLGARGAREAAERVVEAHRRVGALCPSGVATVIDAMVEDGSLWVVTEWVRGTPLSELLLERGRLDRPGAARIGLGVLDVLEAAHEAGVTHGELSPGQVFVQDGDRVVLTGFGTVGTGSRPRLTAPSYAAPEQVRGEVPGPAADLWALGAILHATARGRPPASERSGPGGFDRPGPSVWPGAWAGAVRRTLRPDPRDRPDHGTVRAALRRVAIGDCPGPSTTRSRPHDPCARAIPADGRRGGRAMLAGTALAAGTVTVVVLATAHGLPRSDGPAAPLPPRPSAPASPEVPGAPGPDSAAPSAGAESSPGVPAGFRTYTAREGFSVALPEGWRRIDTRRVSDLAYRIVFGTRGDPRTLAVTHSTRVGPDPVAVWRDDVEPGLMTASGYDRLGEIRATTHQGRRAADMEWLAEVDGSRFRTFGRGFLIGEGRGFSLRFTAPAGDWREPVNEGALATFLRTFREPGAGPR
ncbi:serine/threonine protein kinase [Streptomyces sp. ZYX-F-203]